MFNYSTGPVELTENARRALSEAPGASHMPQAQQMLAETLQLVHSTLGLPDDFLTLFVPGTIRQALHLVIRNMARRDLQVNAIATGYWGTFLGRLAEAQGAQVLWTDAPNAELSTRNGNVVLAVHVETEHGVVLPIEPALRHARDNGALTVVDVACSIPIDPLDFACSDILVLGSHKCLGGPPGLGIVSLRRSLLERHGQLFASDWPLEAYLADALWKWDYLRGKAASPSSSPPLVSYPIQVVAGLRAALLDRQEAEVSTSDHATAAAWLREALRASGFSPYVGSGTPSAAVIRADVPKGVETQLLRQLVMEQGFYILGNIGASAGGSIRIGTMSLPQIAKGNLERLMEAIRRAVKEARRSGTRASER